MRRNRIVRALALALACLGAVVHPAFGQAHYQLPPKTIVDILDAKPLPTVVVSPSRQEIALLERSEHADDRRPVAADAAAGRRAHQPEDQRPAADDAAHRHHPQAARRRPEDQGGGARRGAKLDWLGFSPDGGASPSPRPRRPASRCGWRTRRRARRRPSRRRALNATMGTPCEWVNGGTLLCQFVPATRGPAPKEPLGTRRARTSRRTSARRRRSAPTRTC